MSTRRRKWPTFRTSFSLCSFLLSLCLFSLYRRRIPSGLLFVIHSINVCCLWDLLLLFFFVILYLFRMYSIWYCCFDLCHAISTHTHTHTVLFVCVCVCDRVSARWWLAFTHVMRLRPSGGEFRFVPTCVCVNLPKPLLLCHASCVESVYWFMSLFSHKTFYGKQVW